MKYEKLTRGDYISLGKAVAKFNRTIRELEKEGTRDYLPETLVYTDVKNMHVTKSELDKYIKNLRNFSEENATEVIYESGQSRTKWESDLLEEERQIALRRMRAKLGRVNKYDKKAREQLEFTIKNLTSLEKISDNYDFKDTVRRIHRIGVRDYDMRRAIQFRENYYKALEQVSNYKHYEEFKKRLDRFTNPLNFFKFIQKSEVLAELFLYYKRGAGLVVGNYATNEDAFNDGLLQLGFKIEEEIKLNE